MATRSYIGKMDPQTKVITYIYCHYDGYLSHTGKMLVEHYNDESKVDELLKLGDLSFLDEQIGEKHDFKKPTPGWTIAYSRDRGEQVKSNNQTYLEDYNTSPVIDYFYLFTEGGWKYSTGNGWNKVEIEKVEV